MSLGRIWDYLMRRKPMLLTVVMLIAASILSLNVFYVQNSPKINFTQETSPEDTGTFKNDLILKIGTTTSLTLELTNDYSQATIQISEQAIEHDAYIRILDRDGQLLAGEYTELRDDTPVSDRANIKFESESTGVQYFWIDAPKNYSLDLEPGDVIEVHGESAKFYSTLNNDVANAFMPDGLTERYVVMENGIRKATWSETEGKTEVYNLLKQYIVAQIEAYQSQLSDEVLNNRHLDLANKTRIMLIYRSLAPEDQEKYREFVEHLRIGGVPELTYHGEHEYKVGDKIDFATLISARDGEDGEFPIEKIVIEDQVDFMKPGEYLVIYQAEDSDGNATRLRVTIRIVEADTPELPEEPEQPDMSDREPVTVLPDPGLVEEEDFSKTDGTNLPPVSPITNIGEGANTADDYGAAIAVADENGDNTATTEDGVHEVTQEKLDNLADSTRPIRNDASRDNNESQTNAKSISFSQILLIAFGVLVVIGLIRFIFDHYIR